VPLGEPGHVVDDRGPAGLDAAVIAVDRLRHIVEHGIGVVEQQLDVLEERLLVALDGQHMSGPAGAPRPHMGSPPRSTIARAVAFWQCMASAVTIQPSSVDSARGSGKAVISFDLPSTLRCPSASRVSPAKALMRCSGA